MYACICHAVTEDSVHEAIDSGANTLDAISEHTDAGTSCGSCHDTLEDLIEARCGGCPLAGLHAA